MPLPPGELRKLQDEERRRAAAHRRLRWARRRRVALWLLGGALTTARRGVAHQAARQRVRAVRSHHGVDNERVLGRGERDPGHARCEEHAERGR